MQQRIVLTFRGTLQAGGLGQEEPHEVQERELLDKKCQLLLLVRNNPKHQVKVWLTAGQHLCREGPGSSHEHQAEYKPATNATAKEVNSLLG